MKIQENQILAPYTTFKIGGPAKFFCVVRDQHDALEAYDFAKEKHLPTFVLGGGSNILISDSGFPGLVMKIENKGIEILQEDDKEVFLKVASGENWDSLVGFAVRNGWWGIENLSHIPGSTGAVAVQNVGAYGQEASDVLDSVLVFDRTTGQILSLKNADCGFAYRKSIFNSMEKGRYIIFYITLRLSKIPKPKLTYGDLKNYFTEKNIPDPGQEDIRVAVTHIRDQKFPFPTAAVNGNAGSFFRGPILSEEKLENIKTIVKEIFGQATYDRLGLLQDNLKVSQGYKTPTAFLLEILGLKGYQYGGAKINESHPAIVLNANGKATSEDLLELNKVVRHKVKEMFGIDLEVEPELVGFTPEELKSFGL